MGTAPQPMISMYCALSQNCAYEHLFEKQYIMLLKTNKPKEKKRKENKNKKQTNKKTKTNKQKKNNICTV